MKLAKIISLLGILSMTAVLIFGFTEGNFSADGSELLKDPGGWSRWWICTLDSSCFQPGSSLERKALSAL